MKPILIIALLSVSVFHVARSQSGWPIDPAARHISEYGRMEGWIKQRVHIYVGQDYGLDVWPLGDIDSDGLNDWIVSSRLCDTAFGERDESQPVVLLLYHGERGRLPAVGSGQRIGPTELSIPDEVL